MHVIVVVLAYVPPLLVLLLATGLVASMLRIRLESAMPIALMSIAIVLYVFYISGILHSGFIALIVMIAAGTVVNLVRLVRVGRLRLLATRVFTPQLATFLLVCAISYLATRHSTVRLWDELRLWGAYPKILHDSGTLQLGQSADLFAAMQSYPPGMPLLAYFFGAFSFGFQEPMVFFAYAVTAAIFLLPISRLLTWRHFFLVPLAAGLIIGIVLYFWNSNDDNGNFFGSLFIDSYLGLLGGYGCYQIATAAVHRRAGIVALALTSATLYLFKETGLLFGVVLIAAALVQVFITKLRFPIPKSRLAKTLALRALTLAGPLLAVVLSWKLLLAANGIGATLDANFAGIKVTWQSIASFANALLNRSLVTPSMMLTGALEHLFVALCLLAICIALSFWLSGKTGVSTAFSTWKRLLLVVILIFMIAAGCGVVFAFSNGGGSNFSYVPVTLIAATIAIGVFVRTKSEESKRKQSRDLAIAVVTAAVLNVVFIIGLYILTTVAFGGIFYSFERYMSTVCVLDIAFLALFITSRAWPIPNTAAAAVATSAVATSIAILALLFPLRETVRFDGGWDSSATQISSSVLRKISLDRGTIEDSPKIRVFLVFTGDPQVIAGLHHRIYFDLLGSGIIVRNFYTETQISTPTPDTDPGYDSRVKGARAAFKRQLATGQYDYVFLVEQDASLKSQFGKVLPGGIAQNALYRVLKQGSDVSLVRVR